MFQACQEIQSLQSETENLKSVKICLNQQRDAYIRDMSQRTGEELCELTNMMSHACHVTVDVCLVSHCDPSVCL